MTRIYTQTLLHLSSDHMTEDATEWLTNEAERRFPIAVVILGDGLLIRLDDFERLADEFLGVFVCLDDVTEYAHEMGASWLLLDPAGQKCKDLTDYKDIE